MERGAELNSQPVITRSHIAQANTRLDRINSVHNVIVEHAFGHAQGARDNLLGVVLNTVDMNVFGRYASHRENYYYTRQYARYGYTE
jgi:hypothetical protein